MTHGVAAFLGFSLLAAPLVFTQDPRVGDESQDVARIQALASAYTSAWIDSDPEAVLDVFADGAVLVPHQGNPQAEGKDAIRRHFWPPGTPPIQIEAFSLTSMDIVVEGELGYDRGAFELAFTMEGTPDRYTSRGNYVAVARKDDEGRWKWVLYTWNHP